MRPRIDVDIWSGKFGGHERAHEIIAIELEITAVPTYVFDGKWTVPGAQDPDTFVTVLRRVIARRTADV